MNRIMAFKHRIRQLLSKGQGDDHFREMLLGSFVALTVKLFAAISIFLMNIVVARKLGAAEAGFFHLGLAIVAVVAAFGRIGLDNTFVRLIAGEIAAGSPAGVLSIYRKGMLWAAIVSTVLASIVFLFAEHIASHLFNQERFGPVLRAMAFSIPLLALSILHAQALQGLKRIAQAMTVLSVAIPFTLTLGLLMLPGLNAPSSALLYLGCCAITLLLAYFWWLRARPSVTTCVNFPAKRILRSCLPLWSVIFFAQAVQWSSQLMLGAWGTPVDVALFSGAMRTAMLASFILVAVNSIAAPKFAAMYRNGDIEGLRRTAVLSTRMMVVGALPVVLVMLLMPEWLMGLFGDEFRAADSALMILAVGQFVNVATGSVGYLLAMSGNERLLRFNAFIGALLAIILGAGLIPAYGLTGAAIATSTAIGAQNLLCAYHVRKVLKINPYSK